MARRASLLEFSPVGYDLPGKPNEHRPSTETLISAIVPRTTEYALIERVEGTAL
jgi:hypothetical protein